MTIISIGEGHNNITMLYNIVHNTIEHFHYRTTNKIYIHIDTLLYRTRFPW